jgi:16S rRNA processing protein RimM
MVHEGAAHAGAGHPGRLLDRDRLVCIGRVSGAHGLGGEVKVTSFIEEPERYLGVRQVVLDTVRGLRAFEVERLRDAGGQWLLKLKGLAERNAAEPLKGADVLVEPVARSPLGENEYFAADLIGCTVETVGGEMVGRVSGVMDAGAQHLLRVQGPRGEVLVPLAETIVKEVHLDRRAIRIDPPPGLLELSGR